MKIVFCLPGKTCSAIHRNSWIAAIDVFYKKNIDIEFRDYFCSDIYFCRNHIVRGLKKGEFKTDKPFGGMDYDFMMWIDSDVAFYAEGVLKLIESDIDIISGVVPAALGDDTSCFGRYDKDAKGRMSNIYNCKLSRLDKIPLNDKGLMEIDYTGFAFICVKKGVFERIGYPYFRTMIQNHSNGESCVLGEDLGWCINAKKCGFEMFLDPSVKVVHDQSIPLFMELI